MDIGEALVVLRAMAEDVDADGNWGSCRHGSYEAVAVALKVLDQLADDEGRRHAMVGALRIAGVLPMGEIDPQLMAKVHRASDYLSLAARV